MPCTASCLLTYGWCACLPACLCLLCAVSYLYLSSLGTGTYLGNADDLTDEQVLMAILYSATRGWNVIDTGARRDAAWAVDNLSCRVSFGKYGARREQGLSPRACLVVTAQYMRLICEVILRLVLRQQQQEGVAMCRRQGLEG